MKIYEVFTTDIWNNNYLIGFFKNLDDCIDIINLDIDEPEAKLQKGDITEYPSTLSMVFDTYIGDILNCRGVNTDNISEDTLSIQIRGFILDSELVIENLQSL